MHFIRKNDFLCIFIRIDGMLYGTGQHLRSSFLINEKGKALVAKDNLLKGTLRHKCRDVFDINPFFGRYSHKPEAQAVVV
jgi:hypothetical protein